LTGAKSVILLKHIAQTFFEYVDITKKAFKEKNKRTAFV